MRRPRTTFSTEPIDYEGSLPSSATEAFSKARLNTTIRPKSPIQQAYGTAWTTQDGAERVALVGGQEQGNNDGPEMLYARMAEAGGSPSPPSLIPTDARYFYMGESFSLSFVVKTVCNPSVQDSCARLHFPIPNSGTDQRTCVEGDIDPGTLEYLRNCEAFTLPPSHVTDQLIQIFFECIHPAFPVFDRQEFCLLYQQGQASLLVLQTICFLSFTVANETLLKSEGYDDRHLARKVCYLRAKALYDMDYERNKVTMAAVLFLLGFCWEGPEDQKDAWYWLGTAISLAQTLGMHRS